MTAGVFFVAPGTSCEKTVSSTVGHEMAKSTSEKEKAKTAALRFTYAILPTWRGCPHLKSNKIFSQIFKCLNYVFLYMLFLKIPFLTQFYFLLVILFNIIFYLFNTHLHTQKHTFTTHSHSSFTFSHNTHTYHKHTNLFSYNKLKFTTLSTRARTIHLSKAFNSISVINITLICFTFYYGYP